MQQQQHRRPVSWPERHPYITWAGMLTAVAVLPVLLTMLLP